MDRGLFMESLQAPAVGLLEEAPRRLRSEMVRVPVKTIRYLQAMAENGPGDRPKPIGQTPPIGYISYRQ